MEIGTVIFTKVASTGAAVEITLDAVDRFGHPWFRAHVDGVPAERADTRTIILSKPKDLHGFGAGPTVGLTGADRARLEAAMAEVAAVTRAAHAATAAGHEQALRRRRAELAAAVRAAVAGEDGRFDAARAQQDEAAWTGKRAGDAAIATAREALAAFDAEHPQVVAAITAATEAERAQSFVARGLD